MYLTKPWLIILLAFAASPAFGQADTAGEMQNLFFIEKGQLLVPRPDDYVPDTCGFYIYRNAEYYFILSNWNWIRCRIRDIRHDSVYVAVYDASLDRWFDHVYSPSELRVIRLPTSSAWRIKRFSLDDYEPVFEQTTTPKKFDWPPRVTFSRDSLKLFERPLIAVVTETGIDTLAERPRVLPNPAKENLIEEKAAKNTGRVRRGLWFTPSGAREIRGVNIGLISGSLGQHHFLLEGVNLNADVATAFMAVPVLLLTFFDEKWADLSGAVWEEGEMGLIEGVSVSAGGLYMNCDLRGFSINGGMCLATQVRGVVVSGIENISDYFHGVQISALHNRSGLGRGVQIGLFNVCKHLHGIQIGLVNVNSKRSLPFVNWDFERVKN